MEKGVVVLFTGDIGPNRKEPETMFTHVEETLRASDIVFGQLETNLSLKGRPLPYVRLALRSDPRTATAIREAGYDVLSFASNHCLDYGVEAFLDTIQNLKKEGLYVIGAGSSIDEARKAALIERNGTKIAFLAYNSILPKGYEADRDKPGCAPLRAFTFYEQVEPDQPGTPPKIHTFLHEKDKIRMEEDIRQAKSVADIVIVSMHFGIHFVPATIAEYQKEAARKAIDAGADLVIGHHPHILKGVELYKGKAIFYSLGNFALESPFSFDPELRKRKRHEEIVRLNPLWGTTSSYPLPPDTRKTMAVKAIIGEGKIVRVSILPCWLMDGMEPRILKGDENEFHEVLGYLREITERENLNGTFTVEKDEALLLVEAPKKERRR